MDVFISIFSVNLLFPSAQLLHFLLNLTKFWLLSDGCNPGDAFHEDRFLLRSLLTVIT